MTVAMAPATGQQWKMRLGGYPYVIVALDERFVYVKDARLARKSLLSSAGASPVSRRELREEWKQVAS